MGDGRRRWAPDSWVRIILVLILAQSMLFVTGAIAWRAINSPDPAPIEPATILDILNALLAVFAVALGYVLGASSRKGDDQ